jgi:hypothetical protein
MTPSFRNDNECPQDEITSAVVVGSMWAIFYLTIIAMAVAGTPLERLTDLAAR